MNIKIWIGSFLYALIGGFIYMTAGVWAKRVQGIDTVFNFYELIGTILFWPIGIAMLLVLVVVRSLASGALHILMSFYGQEK